MQLSYPISQYKNCVLQAFCSLAIGIQYASQLPNQDRFIKFLTRLKEASFDSGDPLPGLTTTDLCKTGLPVNWCYIQYNRGPLVPVEEDEFRLEKIRQLSSDKSRFDEDRWGFGRTDINCWLVGNNGSAIEAAESLFYMHLYRIKTVDYMYLGIPWRSRIIHDPIGTFEELGVAEYGTGFTITWRAQLFVPILREEIEGYTVQETCTEIFDASLSFDIRNKPDVQTPLPLDLTKSVSGDISIHSYYDTTLDTVVVETIPERCADV